MNLMAPPAAEWCVMRTGASRPELIARIVSFARDRRGVSAIEFAMLLPVMVTLYLGVVEVSRGVAIDRKVTLTTRTMADLASRVTSINNADMTNMLNATSAVIAPYDQSMVQAVLAVPNTTLIWSEVSYNYNPTFGYVLTGNMNLNDQIYMRPRLSDTITRV